MPQRGVQGESQNEKFENIEGDTNIIISRANSGSSHDENGNNNIATDCEGQGRDIRPSTITVDLGEQYYQ